MTHNDVGTLSEWGSKLFGATYQLAFEYDLDLLIALFGPPNEEEQDKVTMEWNLEVKEYDDDLSTCFGTKGRFVSVYDWKGSYRYGGSWHIGGHNKTDALILNEIIQKSRANRLATSTLPVPAALTTSIHPARSWRVINQ